MNKEKEGRIFEKYLRKGQKETGDLLYPRSHIGDEFWERKNERMEVNELWEGGENESKPAYGAKWKNLNKGITDARATKAGFQRWGCRRRKGQPMEWPPPLQCSAVISSPAAQGHTSPTHWEIQLCLHLSSSFLSICMEYVSFLMNRLSLCIW